MYTYNAAIVRVIDGDTLVVNIDLGFHTWRNEQTIRLLGCNAREIHDQGGPEARDNLTAMLPAGTPVVVSTVAPDKYADRYDASITVKGVDLVQTLITSNWAAAWNGRGDRPQPPWPRPDTKE